MWNKKQLKEEKEFLVSLRYLAEGYQQVDILKMKKIRSKVVSARDFLAGLGVVYGITRKELEKSIKIEQRQKSKAALKNNKRALVLLTANQRLYGGVINEIVELFLKTNLTGDFDLIVIGRAGKDILDNQRFKLNYRYFDLPEEGDQDSLKKFASLLSEYYQVKICYGKFLNLLTQTPFTFTVGNEEEKEEKVETKSKFFFEPDLENILNFFEGQINFLVLSQSFHEGELAKSASRILVMENMLSKLERSSLELKFLERKSFSSVENKKQQQIFSSIYALEGL